MRMYTKDIRLANLVAYKKKGQGGSEYYYSHSIDHEFAFEAMEFSLDPDVLVHKIKDFIGFKPEDSLLDKVALYITFSPKTQAMYEVLQQSVKKDIPFVAQFYEKFAALEEHQLRAIPEKLNGFITPEEKQHYTDALLTRWSATRQYIAQNQDIFETLRQQREAQEKEMGSISSYADIERKRQNSQATAIHTRL